jgi:CYTH domain-containing protein
METKEYRVVFTREYEYNIDAIDADEALNIAYEKFRERCLHPVANTSYDWVEVECIDEEEDEE